MAVEKLTSSTYGHWKFEMKVYLISRDLWDIVEGTEELEDDATEKEKKEFRKREKAAWSNICLSVSRDLQIYVRNTNTAKEACFHENPDICIEKMPKSVPQKYPKVTKNKDWEHLGCHF